MLSKQQKRDLVNSLAEELKTAKGVVLSDFQGLATRDSQELRANLRKENISHKVVKITLLKRALRQVGIDIKNFNFQVPMAISVSQEDEIAAARILQNFAKTHEHLKILAGVLDQKFIDGAEVRKLAALPSKQELLGQTVGVIASPLRGLVSVLAGNIRGLLNVLNAKAKVTN